MARQEPPDMCPLTCAPGQQKYWSFEILILFKAIISIRKIVYEVPARRTYLFCKA